jgi:hypothetical protein
VIQLPDFTNQSNHAGPASASSLIGSALAGLRKAAGIVHKTDDAIDLEAQGPIVWLKALFPRLFSIPLAPHHEELWQWFWAALIAKRDGLPFPKGENAFFAIWSRGHSKSTHARILPIAEAALLGQGYCLYISGTQELANAHLVEIEGLLDSDEIRRYYPDITRPEKSSISNQSKSWKQDLLRTAAGYIIQGIGLNVGIRGANKKGLRPSLMVPDDIDDKKDSPLVSENKADTFLSSVLPTKGNKTLFVCAQNLIMEHGVVNQMYTGKVRALVNARISGPHPAMLNMKTEERKGDDGRIRDVITSGTPTWPGYGRDRCQEDIDDYTLPVFKRECQHDLRGSREGRMLKPWNEDVHVITWEEFEAVFGTREIPRHWNRYGYHDWSATRSDYHACVAGFMAVSSQDSPLPGCFFHYEAMSFDEGTQADDVGMRIAKFVAPEMDWDALLNAETVRAQLGEIAKDQDVTRALARRRQVIAGVVRERVSEVLAYRPFSMLHMSHEAKTARSVYRNIYGLPYDPCNPGASGGVEEMNHFMRVDYDHPHAFRAGWMGYTRYYVIVNKRTEAKDASGQEADQNAELLRYQFDRWKWRPPTLTNSGLLAEKPLKQHDDYGNGHMMLFVHLQMQARALTKEQRRIEALPTTNRPEAINALPDEEKSGAIAKTIILNREFDRGEERKNIYDPHMRAKLKRKRGRR